MALTHPPPVSTVPTPLAQPQRPGRVTRFAAPPRLSVVVVNYRQWRNTAQLVRGVLAEPCSRHGLVEAVVVDNHSPAHPLAGRMRRWPGVSLRRWRRNRGFAAAANEGCRLSQGDWLLLLNPDVTLPEGFLDGVLELAERLEKEDPRAGVAGFQLRHTDGSPQWSAGPWPTLLGTLAGLLLPRSRRKCRPVRSRRRCRVPWVTGCCLLLRRDCWKQLDGFDEDYFLYYEDVDFCRRAKAARWHVWYEPGLHVVHHQPLHVRRVPPHLRLCTRHGLLTYAAKHWAGWEKHLLTGIVRLEARLRQWWARRRGHPGRASMFGQLADLARDFAAGRRTQARRRLDRVIREV
jgi:N-acetylglucosaminyl-diphospho-decaprenol L-rhamnosyltransferase